MTTLNEALSAVMGDVREVRKDDRNQAQKFNFRGVDAVMNAVGPALRRHKVRCTPEVLDHMIQGKTTAKGQPVTFVTVKVKYTFTGPEGDQDAGVVVAEATDFSDKATAKAMSVAYRTFLLQALCLPTDDPDPDLDHPEAARPPRESATPDWQGQYKAAHDRGRDTFANFIAWAKKNGGPPEMIQAGERDLASRQPVEGEVITDAN